jgi:hypothetical protein
MSCAVLTLGLSVCRLGPCVGGGPTPRLYICIPLKSIERSILLIPIWYQNERLEGSGWVQRDQSRTVACGCIATTNHVQHQCTKHIEIDLYFIRECIVVGDVHILPILMTSQFFTK